MAGNKIAGDFGEQEIVDKMPCPNCGKTLMLLPKNYPLFDLQCTGCSFRAQVKTKVNYFWCRLGHNEQSFEVRLFSTTANYKF